MKREVLVRAALLVAVSGSFWLVPGRASACELLTVCLSWAVQSVDSGFGEDYGVGDSVPARGGRVTIIPPPPEFPQEVYLDEGGCHTFQSEYTAGFKIVAYSDALLGVNRSVRIRAYEQIADIDPDVRYATTIHVGEIVPGTPFQVDATPYHPAFNLLAWATHTFWHIDHLTSPRLDGPHQMQIVRAGVSAGGELLVQIRGPSDADPNAEGGVVRKFLIAGALIEGIAHFLAAVAFNDIFQVDGTFVYYKEIDVAAVPDYQEFVDQGSRVSLGATQFQYGGQARWVETMCPTDLDAPGGDVTSEIDWMRFWWQFLTALGNDVGARPSLWQVLQVISFTHDENPWTPFVVWPNFLATFDNPGSTVGQHQARFVTLGAANGVEPQ